MNTLTAGTMPTASRSTVRPSHTLVPYTLHLLRRGLRSAAIWAVSVALYTVVMIFSFPSLRESTSAEDYPEAMQRAFNIGDMSTINGYLSSQVFSFITIVLAIFPLLALAGSIAGAEERGRLDILLGTPLSRRDLLVASVIATASSLFGIVVVMATASWLAGQVTADVDLSATDIFGATLALWPFAMFFGAIALVISTVVRRFATAAGISIGIMVAMYAIDTIAKVAENDALRMLSAFRYYGDPMVDGVDWPGAIGLVIASLILVVVAALRFERRDIYT